MARRLIPMVEIDEVLFRYQQGHTVSAIARALGQSRVTVRKYLKAALAAGLARGGGEEERTRVASAVRAVLRPRPVPDAGPARALPRTAGRGRGRRCRPPKSANRSIISARIRRSGK